ncbi:MAG: ribonuclease E/G [Litorimonas sp.]
MKRRAVIEDGIGETRAAVYEGRRLVEFHLRRHVGPHMARAKDIYTGRVSAVDPSVAGAFVDLGIGPAGLLKFSSRKALPKLTEGMLIDVEISRAAIGTKGPNLKFTNEASRDAVGPVKCNNLREYLTLKYPEIIFEETSVSALDDAVERNIAIKGGGSVWFDQTQALLAIDVDKGSESSPLDNSLAAATLIASQLRLRGLGGLIVIDFPNLRQAKHRTSLLRHLEKVFETDAAIVKIAPMSRFGCIELTRSIDDISLDALVNDRFGRPTLDTLALRAIRRLEREGSVNAGAKLTLHAPEHVFNWLETTELDWRGELTSRIGARFDVKLGQTIDVSVDR